VQAKAISQSIAPMMETLGVDRGSLLRQQNSANVFSRGKLLSTRRTAFEMGVDDCYRFW
jgi:hypothetical protein